MNTCSISNLDKGSFTADAALVSDVIEASMASLNLGNTFCMITEPVTVGKKTVEKPVITVKNARAFATIVEGNLADDGIHFNQTGVAGWLKVKVFADGTRQLKFDAARR